MTVEVIIPTYRPGKEFGEVLFRLSRQSVTPRRIHVINTEEKYWNSSWEKEFPLVEVTHITKGEFDHGGTRRMAAEKCREDIMVLMTQDAVPCRRDLLSALIAPLCRDDRIGAAYARQRPKKGSSPIEKYTREFNYPEESHVRFAEDIDRYGIKTFYCSNVCAAYRKSSYVAAGGFPEKAIFNEDMIIAKRLLNAGFGVAYAAEAEVYHSHDYSPSEQFHRNFDIGVSHAENPDVFKGIVSEGEGIKLVWKTADHLLSTGRWYLLPGLFVMSGCKYAGYLLGENYRKLSAPVVRFCAMNKDYLNLSHF